MRIYYRPRLNLDGVWWFKLDPEDVGENKKWFEGLPSSEDIYVPSSWNEQNPSWESYMGVAWYERRFFVPAEFRKMIPWIVFEGVNYRAKVWVNGAFLGGHEGGFTSFKFNAEGSIRFGEENALVVRVDDELTPHNIPPGESMNKTYFDFFHYGGIHRPVYLEFTKTTFIDDLKVVADHRGHLDVEVEVGGEVLGELAFKLLSPDGVEMMSHREEIKDRRVHVRAKARGVKPWSPENPVLYKLRVKIHLGEDLIDWVDEHIGFRTVEVKGGKLLLNGKPVFLKGFGRHEDFPVTGKYVPGAVLIRDFNLMKSLGANSFRTTHYPYSRLHMDLADRYGFLVILEAPLVGLRDVHFKDEKYLEKAKKVIEEMVREHRNRPSVIMYSVANEPLSSTDNARGFIEELYNHVRQLDPTRPITFASMLHAKDKALGVVDVISLNLYFGWYSHHGNLDAGVKEADETLEEVHKMYPGKPILVTEFGAGAINGLHSDPPEMWSEEYQAEFLRSYIKMFKQKSFLIGFHIWCFADFKTPQSHFRTVLNRKGLFTRIREPKLAAHVIRREYSEKRSDVHPQGLKREP